MNNPNPFLPQGAFLDQKNKARTRLKIAVYFSISLSVMVLMVLLIQGCKKPNEPTDGSGTDTLATNQQLPNLPEIGSASNALPTNAAPETNLTPMVSTPPPPVTPPPPPVPETQEYTIVKNDTFATIATHNNTTAKAIQAVNPGVDPKKLKIGQKIKLPAPATTSTSVSPMAAPGATDTAAAGGTITYKVKSGDSLTTIAKKYHGVTIKAIQQANNLTTTSIKVGQVLKIPGAVAPVEPAPMTAPVPAPAPSPTTTPAPTH